MTIDVRGTEEAVTTAPGGVAAGGRAGVPPRAPSAKVRAARLFGRFRDPKYAVFLIVGLILAYQIAIPLVMLLWNSLVDARPGSASYLTLDAVTLDNYRRGFAGERFGSVIWSTTVFSLGRRSSRSSSAPSSLGSSSGPTPPGATSSPSR